MLKFSGLSCIVEVAHFIGGYERVVDVELSIKSEHNRLKIIKITNDVRLTHSHTEV